MADERFDAREAGLNRGTWTLLFRGFQVALDWKKLLLAAGGILATAIVWYVLAVIFGGDPRPVWPGDYEQRQSGKESSAEQDRRRAWEEFKRHRTQWNLRYKAAGNPDLSQEYVDAGDIANTPEEYDRILKDVLAAIQEAQKTGRPQPFTVEPGRTVLIERKPAGLLRLWPFSEDRGPNPYLMVTGQAGRADAEGTPRYAPWDRGQFFDWFSTRQLPVLLEPIVKFARPVVYLLSPDPGFRNRVYFLLVIAATLAIWSFVGGAITRIAAVQLARKEKISLGEALRFACRQWKSYLFASVAPLLLVAVLVFCLILYGIPTLLIPYLGDVIGGALIFLVFLAGAFMAAVLVGYMVGWPMIQATISTEGSDSFDALSRTYSYVFQAPWYYLGYAAMALAYGAVLVFFVGFMGSLSIYLGKWGLSQTPFTVTESWNRDPSFLFAYAPESFGWKALLLQGASVDGAPVVQNGEIQPDVYAKYLADFGWNKHVGAFLVGVWLALAFLMVIGFGYSYFWSASTILYLLMRQRVDDTDLDEVYLEEEDIEDVYTPPPPVDTSTAKAATSLTMVEPPAVRTPPPPAPAAAPDGEGAKLPEEPKLG